MTAKTRPTSSPADAPRRLTVLAAWAEAPALPGADEPTPDLAAVARLARRQLDLEAVVAAAEEELKRQQKALFDVRCLELPEALSACGLSKVTLSTGEVVEVRTEYYCSLTGQYRAPAIAWLQANGLTSIITQDVIASFGKDESKKAAALLKLLGTKRFKGVPAKLQENVNTATFKALVREKIEAGEAVPVDELGVTVQDAAKITPPRRGREL